MTLHRPGCICEFCSPAVDSWPTHVGDDDGAVVVVSFLEDVAAIADARGLSDPPTAPPLQMGVDFGGASDPYDDRSPRGDE